MSVSTADYADMKRERDKLEKLLNKTCKALEEAEYVEKKLRRKISKLEEELRKR